MTFWAWVGEDRKRARNMSMSFAPWRVAVWVREPKTEMFSEPAALRVPMQTFRKMTSGRA